MPNLSLKALIDEQIETSRGMNLFSEDSLDSFQFSDSILGSLDEILKANDEELAGLVEHAKRKTLAEFCYVNQYYTIDTAFQQNLKTIYLLLLDEIHTWKKGQGQGVRTYLGQLGRIGI